VSGVLRGVTWDHPRGVDSVRGAAALYTRRHPQVVVEWETRSLQGFADQSLAALASNYDLIVLDHPHIPLAHDQQLLLPLESTGHDEELAEQAAGSVGPSFASYAHGGHQYGLAIDVAAQVAVYRPDLLPEPPRDWTEVFALAGQGRVLWAAKPVDAISSFMTLMATTGHSVGVNGVFADRDSAVEVLATMCRLAASVPRQCLSANPIEIAEQLSGRDDRVYAPLTFGYSNYSRKGFRRRRLQHVDMPGGPHGLVGSCLGGAGIAVSRFTADPTAAIHHAFWLASPDVQRGVYYDSGGQPGHAGAWDDDRTNADSLDFFRGTRATLEHAWVRPRDDGWLVVQSEVGTLVNQVLLGDLDPRVCLERAESVYQRSREKASTTASRT